MKLSDLTEIEIQRLESWLRDFLRPQPHLDQLRAYLWETCPETEAGLLDDVALQCAFMMGLAAGLGYPEWALMLFNENKLSNGDSPESYAENVVKTIPFIQEPVVGFDVAYEAR